MFLLDNRFTRKNRVQICLKLIYALFVLQNLYEHFKLEPVTVIRGQKYEWLKNNNNQMFNKVKTYFSKTQLLIIVISNKISWTRLALSNLKKCFFGPAAVNFWAVMQLRGSTIYKNPIDASFTTSWNRLGLFKYFFLLERLRI